MKDLSSLLPSDPITALAPTSQAGGNMMSDSKQAMTAPGSEPVDPLPDRSDQGNPKVTASNGQKIMPAHDGKPQASKQLDTTPAPRPAWTKTS